MIFYLFLLLLTLPLSAAPESEAAGSLEPLRFGIMPAVDSAPIIVAQSRGYFAEEGLDVEVELFRSQLNREAALQAESIDGTVSDMVNALRAWDSGADYRILTLTQGIFSLIVAPDSAIQDRDSWPELPRSVPTALLEDSIIYYTATRMMEAVALDPETLEIVPTLQIPLRVELLLAGELAAAVLPEPVTRLATAGGARVIVDSRVLPWTPGVVLVTGASLREKPRELEAFLRAYDRAVAELNRNPDAFREAIVAGAALPPATRTAMQLPEYQEASPPQEDQIRDVALWMQARGLLSTLPAREELVAEAPF